MNRRNFTFGAAFASVLGFIGIRLSEVRAEENLKGLPVLKFNERGDVCNADEIFKRVKFGESVGCQQARTRSELAWVSKDTPFLYRFLEYEDDISCWGEVRVVENDYIFVHDSSVRSRVYGHLEPTDKTFRTRIVFMHYARDQS